MHTVNRFLIESHLFTAISINFKKKTRMFVNTKDVNEKYSNI